jgi:lipoprotein NlpD
MRLTMKLRAQRSKHDGLLVCLACAVCLAGCASNPSAPVEDRSLGESAASATRPHDIAPQATTVGGSYRVQRGDTLYAIAFKHGVDFRDLASWNGVASPYRIYPGQELRLGGAGVSAEHAPHTAVTQAAADRTVAAAASAPPAMQQNTQVEKPKASSPTPFENVESTPPVPEPVPPAPPAVAAARVPVATPPPVAPPLRPAAAAVEVPAKPVESAPQLNAGGVNWRWPGNGKVVGTYINGDQTRQGVDIAGNAGDPVQAAADGEVVYSGNGLLGYGELIIVKHNASFLSAYGHNRKRLVQEGDKVKAGQQIAEMGSSASSREELHFEIRKNGKPVNPLDYLPVR